LACYAGTIQLKSKRTIWSDCFCEKKQVCDLNSAVERIWLKTVLALDAGADPPPSPTVTVPINQKAAKIAMVLWLVLIAVTAWCVVQVAKGKRHVMRPRAWRGLLLLSAPILLLLVWWYLFYAPENMPLPLPMTLLSIWRLPLVDYVTALLIGWLGVALLLPFSHPSTRRSVQ
jgi:hypothetical protein